MAAGRRQEVPRFYVVADDGICETWLFPCLSPLPLGYPTGHDEQIRRANGLLTNILQRRTGMTPAESSNLHLQVESTECPFATENNQGSLCPEDRGKDAKTKLQY